MSLLFKIQIVVFFVTLLAVAVTHYAFTDNGSFKLRKFFKELLFTELIVVSFITITYLILTWLS